MVIYKKISIFAVIVFVVFLSSFAVAEAPPAVDERPYKLVQGFVSEESVGGFTLNEHLKVYLLPDTKVLSSSQQELPHESLRGHKWVYVEGPMNSYGNVEAEFIYLLPRIIGRGERGEYPFIKTP